AIGEIALLLREPRSARITASRPTLVVALERAHFDELARDDFEIITAISRMLAARLRATTRGERARRSLVIAVVGEPGQTGVSLVARYLEARLAEDLGGGVARIVVDHDPQDDASVFVKSRLGTSETVADVARRIEDLVEDTRAVVVDLSARTGLDGDAASS